jgi:hypothetical protein
MNKPKENTLENHDQSTEKVKKLKMETLQMEDEIKNLTQLLKCIEEDKVKEEWKNIT